MKNIYLVSLSVGSLLLFSACSLDYNSARPSIDNINTDKTLENINQTPDNTDDNVVSINKQNTLDLSNKDLRELPKYVLNMTNIEFLDLSYNNLTGALPAEIRQLKNLKVLNLGHNQMTGVPAEVGQLANLEILDLSYNQLTGLPYELGNLKNLKKLILTGNAYAVQDLEIIKKGIPDAEIVL